MTAVAQRALGLIQAGEEWWFDRTRRVRTSGETPLDELTVVGDATDSKPYIPVRPQRARQALRALPIRDHSAYTFIDLGSGKGRMLLLAAEYPFRRIVGVEFAVELHNQARKNIDAYRHPKQRCREIESLGMDAAQFSFPEDPLVVYLFNPFGAETMQRLLRRLDDSLDRNPRDVLLVTVFPEFEALIEATRNLRLSQRMPRCHIYRSQLGRPA